MLSGRHGGSRGKPLTRAWSPPLPPLPHAPARPPTTTEQRALGLSDEEVAEALQERAQRTYDK